MVNEIAIIGLSKSTVSWHDSINNIYLSEFEGKRAIIYDNMDLEPIRNGIKYKYITIIDGKIPDDDECDIEHDLTGFYSKSEVDEKIKEISTNENNTELIISTTKAVIDEKLTDGSLAGLVIEDGTITKNKLGPDVILGVQDNEVTTTKIANQAVTKEKLDPTIKFEVQDNEITTLKVLDGAITTSKILNEAVTNEKIASKTITQDKLSLDVNFPVQDNEVTTIKIANGAVTKEKLDPTIKLEVADNEITTSKILNGAVTKEKLDSTIKLDVADNEVTTTKILDLAVTTTKLADGSVTKTKLGSDVLLGVQDNEVTTTKVLDGAITLAKLGSDVKLGIENGEITNEKIYDLTITGAKIADGTITKAKLNQDVKFEVENLSITNDKIVDGTITKSKLDPTMKFGVEDNEVTTTKILDGAVTKAKLGSDITFGVQDNEVTTSKIADLNVTTAKIANLSITTGKLANAAITSTKLADGAITSTKLADGAVGISQASFLQVVPQNHFDNSVIAVGEKIKLDIGDEYETVTDSLFVTSDFMPLINATGLLKFYSYGKAAFFDKDKKYIDCLGNYTDNFLNTDLDMNLPKLANAKYIKLSVKKEDLSHMYVKQNDILISKDNTAYFECLRLNQDQADYVLNNASDKSLSISSIKQIDYIDTALVYDDGYKIAGNGDEGFVYKKFTLIPIEGAATTPLIPINATDLSLWKFQNIKRISFFDKDEAFIDSLYDGFKGSNPPAAATNIFGQFPTLTGSKYVRLSIALENKDNWDLVIDDVGCKKGVTSIEIPKLVINKDNLSEEVTLELSKSNDNLFNINKDTTIVFKKNKDFNSTNFRIPFMCVTNKGTIIAGCDIRYNSANDHSLIDCGTARSIDGGKTWIDKTVAIPNPGVNATYSRVMDATILATKEGRVFLLSNKFDSGATNWAAVNTANDPNWDSVLYHSDDDGVTWQFNQSLKSLLPPDQVSFLGGVGNGIQMKDGTLVLPIQMARLNDTPFNCQSGIIYSTDSGVTWKMSETLVNEYTSECSIVEYPTGTIIINCRQEGANHRSVYKTTNLGTTWEETPMNSGTQQTNTCQGNMCKIKIGFDKEVVLFTNPINDGSNRDNGAYGGYDRSNLSLSVLQNDSKFTPIHTLYRPHSDGYSCMAFDEPNNRLYVVMELDHNLVFKDLTNLLPTIQLYKSLEA